MLPKYIYKFFPQNKVVRDILSKAKIRLIKKDMLSEKTVLKAEKDPTYKKQIIEEYKKGKVTEKLNRKILFALDNSPKYSKITQRESIINDMIFCRYAYGFIPEEYVIFELEGKSAEERRAYLSDVQRRCFSYEMNDVTRRLLLDDKSKTYQAFRDSYKRDVAFIHSKADYDAFVKFSRAHNKFIRKDISGCGGVNAKLYEVSSQEDIDNAFHDVLKCKDSIVEELIIQVPEMAQFNSSSVNTIRCYTINFGDRIELLSQSILRHGRNGSIVDNGACGGVLVGVDSATGKINSFGKDERGAVYETNPESGVEYVGIQIPQWEGLTQLCRQLAAKMPFHRYISWDCALTKDGWVLVEANFFGGLLGLQMSLGHGIGKEFNDILLEIKGHGL